MKSIAKFRTKHCLSALPLLVLGILVQSSAFGQPPENQESIALFKEQVLPILREHCYECHSHEFNDSSGNLMVDSLASLTVGGTRGPAIVPGDPAKSLLLEALKYENDDLQMPPEGRLSDEQIGVVEKWIKSGAAMPKSMRANKSTGEKLAQGSATDHWAYQPLTKFPADESIDRLANELLASEGLTMSPTAEPALLLRRIKYDLLGLPVTYQEKLDLLQGKDSLPEKIEEYLAAPQYGERFARHWMDVARYSDTKGYVFREDRNYPEAFKYRDWLIRSFNEDLPYDRFVKHQLAADLMPENEQNLAALGFLTLGRRFLNNKFDIIDDRLDVVSRGLMGMTLACARCHDHKYDPITQKDYYSLFGVMLNTNEPGAETFKHSLKDADKLRPSFVLLRGSPGNRGERVERQFVEFLAADIEQDPSWTSTYKNTSGRTALAEQIVAKDNPLTARVYANRIWMWLTGSSITDSPSDFGIRCPAPIQQKLLDFLATELIRSGWSTKHLVRLIVSSKLYQQSSLVREGPMRIDPENQLYWRMNRRRSDFESMRDSMLQVAEELNDTLYGPSEHIETRDFSKRRTLYAHIDRQNLPNIFRTFDFASPDTHSPRRLQTTVPQQGLFALNSDFVASLAKSIVSQLPATQNNNDQVITELFIRILARRPEAEEIRLANKFLEASNSAFSQGKSKQIENWICGYGEVAIDDSQDKSVQLKSFSRLPFLTDDSRWQGGPKLPDETLGWCMLSPNGGHPGNSYGKTVVRRWIARRSGKVQLRGVLQHKSEKGDGVRAFVLLNNSTLLKDVSAKESKQRIDTNFHVQAGDQLNLVVACGETNSFDSFTWTAAITYRDGAGEKFNSETQFPGKPKEPLGPMEQLAQALLVANEFTFID